MDARLEGNGNCFSIEDNPLTVTQIQDNGPEPVMKTTLAAVALNIAKLIHDDDHTVIIDAGAAERLESRMVSMKKEKCRGQEALIVYTSCPVLTRGYGV